MRAELPGKYLVDKFVRVPGGNDPDFIPFMLDLVKKEHIDVLLPLATFELLALSQNIKNFEAVGCKVCVSNHAGLIKANDRFLLYKEFRDFDFVPRFKKLNDGNRLAEEAGELGFPDEKVVVKPFISHGSIGLRILDNETDLYDHFIREKPNSISIPLEVGQAIFRDKRPDNILLTEFLPGKEYGVDLFIHPASGEITASFVRDNGDVFHSEISNGRLIEGKKFLEVAVFIVKQLKLAYTINIDFKLDKHGDIKLLEINPRMPATSYLVYTAGFNLPLYSVYAALGRELPAFKINADRRIFSYRSFLVVDGKNEIKSSLY